MKRALKKFNRALSIMLAAVMVLTMVPQTALPVLATENDADIEALTEAANVAETDEPSVDPTADEEEEFMKGDDQESDDAASEDDAAPVENLADNDDEVEENESSDLGIETMADGDATVHIITCKVMKEGKETPDAATIEFTDNSVDKSDGTIKVKEATDIEFTVTLTDEIEAAADNFVTATDDGTDVDVNESNGIYTIVNGSEDSLTGDIVITINVVDKTYEVSAPASDAEKSITWKIKESTAEGYSEDDASKVRVKKSESVTVQAVLAQGKSPVDVTLNNETKKLTATEEDGIVEFTISVVDLINEDGSVKTLTPEYIVQATATHTVTFEMDSSCADDDALAAIKADAYQTAGSDGTSENVPAAATAVEINTDAAFDVLEGTGFSFTLAPKNEDYYKLDKVEISIDGGDTWNTLTNTEAGKYTIEKVEADTVVRVYTSLDETKAYSITFKADSEGSVKEVRADLKGTANREKVNLGETIRFMPGAGNNVSFTVDTNDDYIVDKVTSGTAEGDVLTADSSNIYTYTFKDGVREAVITISTKVNEMDEDRYVEFVVNYHAPVFDIADSNIKPEKDEYGRDTNVYKLTKAEIPELPFTLTVPYGYSIAKSEYELYFVDGKIVRENGAREKSADGSSWIYKYKVVANQIKDDHDATVGTKENPYKIYIQKQAYKEYIRLTYAQGSKTVRYKWRSWEFETLDEGKIVNWGDTVVLQVDEGQTLKVDGKEVTLDAVNKYSFIARLNDDADENASTHVIDVQDAAGGYKLGYAVDPDNTDTTYETVGKNAVAVDYGSRVSLFLTDMSDDPVAISRCETSGMKSTVQKTEEKGKAEVEVKDENVTVTLYVSAGEEEVEAAKIILTSKDATGKILTVKGITKGKSVKLDATSVTSYALTLKESRQTLNAADYDSALKVVANQDKVKVAIADGKLTVEPLVAEQIEVKIQVAATNEDLFDFTIDGQTPALKVKGVTSENQGMHDILLNVAPDTAIKSISYAFDLYYEVTVEQTAGTSTQQKNGTYYLEALNGEGDKVVSVSQLFKVNSETDNEKMENDYTFTVRLVAVETGKTVNRGNPSTGEVGTKLDNADIKFATATANIKPVTFKTRKGYYEEKLSVIKKTTKFYRWQDVVVAIPKFSKNASHIDDIEAVVYDKNGSVVDDYEAHVEVDEDTMEIRMSAVGIGNYDVVIYATASKNVDGGYDMYRASAKVPVTVMPCIDYIGVDGPTQVALLTDSKGNKKDGSISIKATGYYETWDEFDVKAPKQKFIYEFGGTANPKNADKVVVKNNKITVKKDFILGADPDDNSFTVNVIYNDYGTRDENIANERYSPVEFTVTDEPLEIGAVQLVDYKGRPLEQNILTTDLWGARVKITDKNGQEIDPGLVTLTPNKGKIFVYNDWYEAWIQADGYQKNLTIKAVTTDGGKKSKSSIKYTINYPEGPAYNIGTPPGLSYPYGSDIPPYVVGAVVNQTGERYWTYQGTGNNEIDIQVYANDDCATTAQYNYVVKVTGGKIISDKYDQAEGLYMITPTKDEVKVTITDKSVKPAKTYDFTIKDTNWQTAAAPKASTKDKLYAARSAIDGELAIAQTLNYTVTAKDASYNAVKLSWASGPDIGADGTHTITDNSRFTLNVSATTAGTAKYSAVYGNMKEDGTFEPKAKATTLSIKVNKAGTPKAVAQYTINPGESLSVPLEAKAAPVAGMVTFNKVLSANVKGQRNQFYDYFEVSEDGKSLQIRSDKRSAADLKALAELGKDDLTGYVEYQYSIWRNTYSGDECATVVKRDKITVTINSSNK